MPLAASSHEQPDAPRYLSVIDLFARVAVAYFVIVGSAIAVDMIRGDGLAFRSWNSFALQAAAAFLLAAAITRSTLTKWQQASRAFIPAHIVSASAIVGLTLAVGMLAGGFFPDAVGYQRRAPEPFWRAMSALVPLAIAVYLVLRSSGSTHQAVVTAPVTASLDTPLTGEARDAAMSALEILDRGERVLAEFQQRLVSGVTITQADSEMLWQRLDGPDLVAHLRKLPTAHRISKALHDAAAAQTDAVYLVALSQGAHAAVGHTADSAGAFIDEVATRRGQPGADAATLAAVARRETTVHRDIAAGLLQASRFRQ